VIEKPLVGIVILNWNNAPDTAECLESVAQLEYRPLRTYVVDNGSTDGSPEHLAARYPDLHIVSLPTNIGYAAGNNAGMEIAVSEGAEFVLVLNNDTLVEPGFLGELVRAAQAVPGAGMVGPLMLCAHPRSDVFAAGSCIDWWRGEVRHRGMFQGRSDVEVGTDLEQVDFVAGCGVLVSRAVIETVGMLDTQYFLNFEDVEWCVRASRARFKIVFNPAAVMYHKISATLGQGSPANTYYMTRNALGFFWEHAPAGLRLPAVAHILGRTLRTVAAWSLRSAYQGPSFQRKRQANLLAVRDFVLGRRGEMPRDVAQLALGAG
jgi:GT2 family glycosyltransferase